MGQGRPPDEEAASNQQAADGHHPNTNIFDHGPAAPSPGAGDCHIECLSPFERSQLLKFGCPSFLSLIFGGVTPLVLTHSARALAGCWALLHWTFAQYDSSWTTLS